jgi:hypothetical protein
MVIRMVIRMVSRMVIHMVSRMVIYGYMGFWKDPNENTTDKTKTGSRTEWQASY